MVRQLHHRMPRVHAAPRPAAVPRAQHEPLDWAAIFYARAGIPVIPLMPGKRSHATEHGVDDATTDLRRHPRLVATTPERQHRACIRRVFDALDIDIKDGRPGMNPRPGYGSLGTS